MSKRSLSIVLLATWLLIILGPTGTWAVPPLGRLINFKRIEADPEKTYLLTDNDGPWLILASTFAGPGSEQDAHDLVLELRQEYKLSAHLHKKHFDYSQPVQGLGLNRYGEPKRMRYRQQGAFDEWAVMVGDFESVDDPLLDKILKMIKHARPKSLELGPGKLTTQRLRGWRALQQRLNADKEKRKKGPMGHAFATRNPMLPAEFFAPKGLDRFVLEMNEGNRYSLLECPGKYTVRVATFRGNVVLDQRKVKEILGGAQMSSHLEQAAEKATRLVNTLRNKGVKAYEFHDRYESIVTVGSFDSVGTTQANGKMDTHPAILRVMQTYGASADRSNGSTSSIQPKSLANIPFDIQPMLVIVPRYSLGNDYAGSR